MSALSVRLRRVLAEHAARSAVEGADGSLSYAQLDARSAELAARLAAAGVGPGRFVPLLLGRSVEFVVAVAGVLRCGAAYVPIDAASPARRQTALLESFDWSVALVAGERPAVLGEAASLDVTVVDPDLPRCGPGARPEETAWAERDDNSPIYLMFTSGSTGPPKGVVVPDRGVARLVIDPDYVDTAAGDRWALASSVAFDASTLEMWAPLLNGGTCVVQGKALPSLAELGRFFTAARISHGWLTAGLFNLLVAEDPGCLAGFGQLLVGGERESPEHIRRFLAACPDVALIHGYGPTENTTFSLCHRIESVDAEAGNRVPIGRPIRGSTAALVDPDGRTVAGPGEGELLVGGDGVALGYLNDRELTARRFIERDGLRWYRTGDLVRRDERGVYTFLGRADRQVKIQGNRIELDEVEKTLASLPGVGEAVVEVAGEAAEYRHLVAWYTSENGSTPEPDEVLGMLLERLPRIMVPHRLHPMASLPRMISGKVDRRALGAVAERGAGAGGGAGRTVAGGDGPAGLSTETEHLLATIWRETLACEQIDARSRFAESGGTSLLALRVASEIERRFARRVSPIEVLEHPVLRDLARCIDRATPAPAPPPPRPAEGGAAGYTPTRMQRQMLVGSAIDPSGSAYNVHLAMVLPEAVPAAAIRGAIERLVHRHPALRSGATVLGDRVSLQRAEGPAAGWWTEYDEVTLEDHQQTIPPAQLAVLSRRFDLDGAGLTRVDSWPLCGGGSLVVMTVHHAVVDDHSLRLCLGEIVADLAPGGCPVRDAATPVDLAAFEDQRIDRAEVARCAQCVAAVLGGQTPPLPCGPTLGGEQPFTLDADAEQIVQRLARRHRCTPFPVLLAAYGTALQRVFGQPWRFVLTPFSRRGSAELADTVGCVLDLRLLEAGARPGETPTETIHRVCGEVSDCMRPTFVPFEDLVDAVRRHDASLADAPGQFVLTWRTECSHKFEVAGSTGRVLHVPQTGARFGMVLHLAQTERGLEAQLEAPTAVLGSGRAEEVSSSFARVLNEWAEAAGHDAPPPPARAVGSASGRSAVSCDRGGMIAGIWAEVLGAPPAGPDADFLRAGGSSLLALKLAALLHRDCGVEIDLAGFLSDPRYAGLCRSVSSARLRDSRACGMVGSGAEERVVLLIPGAMGRSVGMVALATALRCRSGGSCGFVIPDLEEIMGTAPHPPRGEHFVEHLLATCEQIGADRLAGIVGYSIGGLLGIEVASRLARSSGVDIPVCLLDTYAPPMLRRDIWSRASRRLIRLARRPLGANRPAQRPTAAPAEVNSAEVLSVRQRVEQNPAWRILFEDMARRPVPGAGVRVSLIRSVSTAAAVGVLRWRRSNGFDPGVFASLRSADLAIDHLDLVKGGAPEVAEAMAGLGWNQEARR